MSKPFTIQAMPHLNRHRAGKYYCLRDRANCCAAVVGEVDAIHDGEPTEKHTRLFANAPDTLHWLKQCESALASRQTLGPPLSEGEEWLLANTRAAIDRAECGPLPGE